MPQVGNPPVEGLPSEFKQTFDFANGLDGKLPVGDHLSNLDPEGMSGSQRNGAFFPHMIEIDNLDEILECGDDLMDIE